MADPLNTKIMGDLVAKFFTAFAGAVVTILMAGWTAIESAADSLVGLSIGGGVWVMLIILVFVICTWYVVTRYPDFAGL